MTDLDRALILWPADATQLLQDWDARWGLLDLRQDLGENLFVVDKVVRRDAVSQFGLPVRRPWHDEHYLGHSDSRRGAGWWYRVRPDLHGLWLYALNRDLSLTTEGLKAAVGRAWQTPPRDFAAPVVTWSPDPAGGEPLLSAWWVSGDGANPSELEVIRDVDPLDFLGDAWPVELMGNKSVAVVGTGSIGSVIAETLADYAAGRLVLIDPDRLLQRNLVRHRLGARHLGRYKVKALAEVLRARYPHLTVEAHPIDVITDADQVRTILANVDLVVGAADGVAPRRVVNHLARRAGLPTVQACVLEDGGYGEIVRVGRSGGCLACYRARLVEEGAVDPEPAIDLGYGTGTSHRSMTAVAGDLAVVGTFAAKAGVATLLEQAGHFGQRLPGDVAVIGLRPQPGLPAPFDIEKAGVVRWSKIGPSRPDCVTCSPP
jgi:molybdopterin/thiamine biosynthesis adenylyltransferase